MVPVGTMQCYLWRRNSQTLYKTCTNPPPFGGGPSCIEQNLGPDEEDQECSNQDCRKSAAFVQ